MSVQTLNLDNSVPTASNEVAGSFCDYRGQRFYKIENYNSMARFFMSIVSSSDHWLFISSNGGLTAGRQNATRALFPYYTEDKISDMAHCTGPLTLIREGNSVWQPFASASLLTQPGQRTLYKSALGDQLFFSEEKAGLQFDYGWAFSEKYGVVRKATLTNVGDKTRTVSMLDGLQNLLPANVDSDLQNNNSVLLDAYKSSDCYDNNVAAFSLSSRLTDLAEPAESLSANTVWHHVNNQAFVAKVSIDSLAPEQFVAGNAVNTDSRVRGQRGAYFIEADVVLKPGEKVEWSMACEVSQDSSAVQTLQTLVTSDRLDQMISEDVLAGTQALQSHLAKTDGLQASEDELTAVHHQANALFNMMRGGFFEDGYHIEKSDLFKFVVTRQTAMKDFGWWKTVPEKTTVVELETLLASCESVDLKRLVREYLPISFSRRHGDPSRPWNKFSINLKDASGESIKDYQGNWRDIFQNWEPLAYSYPKFLPSMISAFLNATTADGYNPYRVTRQGIEWEEPEPDNAWANIGYWSDHQIIYLSKLLELQAQMDPSWFEQALGEPRYSFANVPYRIKPFAQLEADPYDSIAFDDDLNAEISSRVGTMGSDGKLLLSAEGEVIHTNLVEKLLTLWLAKLSNFVPEGGLWMNTQRPEWNDANNALAGWGLSVVTVAYLHRHLTFVRDLFADMKTDVSLSGEVAQWFKQTHEVFSSLAKNKDSDRYDVVKQLVESADVYRAKAYNGELSMATETVSTQKIVSFLNDVLPVIADTLHANKRDDDLYHGYNVLHLDNNKVEVEYLPLMLEGQVAVLSANLLTPEQALTTLTALRKSDLYREDQHTYLLYPNKQLPSFTDKNLIRAEWLKDVSEVKAKLMAERVIYQSADGDFHFDVNMRNAKDLNAKLQNLTLTATETASINALFERTFNHKSFTGRSGSFFAYEGLGSTYWHMVSKLLLAAQENWFAAKASGSSATDALAESYYDVRAGIGFNKTPAQYGAFPTDPYSHTPETGIARQPGMTGQVKEELITRLGELGVQWADGKLFIKPGLLRASEFLTDANHYSYQTVANQWESIALKANSLAFTLAQVPFVYQRVSADQSVEITVTWQDGEREVMPETEFSSRVVQHLMERTGELARIDVALPFDNS